MLIRQIPEILEHSFLNDHRADPYPFHIPSYELPSKLYFKLAPSVIQDVCFLAYSNQEFVLCQTSKDIVERLYGLEPCWEKRWAKMLSRWKKREDMEWEDIPMSRVEVPKSRVPARSCTSTVRTGSNLLRRQSSQCRSDHR